MTDTVTALGIIASPNPEVLTNLRQSVAKTLAPLALALMLTTGCASNTPNTATATPIQIALSNTTETQIIQRVIGQYGHLAIYPGGPQFSEIIQLGTRYYEHTYLNTNNGLSLTYKAPEAFFNIIQLNPTVIFEYLSQVKLATEMITGVECPTIPKKLEIVLSADIEILNGTDLRIGRAYYRGDTAVVVIHLPLLVYTGINQEDGELNLLVRIAYVLANELVGLLSLEDQGKGCMSLDAKILERPDLNSLREKLSISQLYSLTMEVVSSEIDYAMEGILNGWNYEEFVEAIQGFQIDPSYLNKFGIPETNKIAILPIEETIYNRLRDFIASTQSPFVFVGN
jgi:hypothetical protein